MSRRIVSLLVLFCTGAFGCASQNVREDAAKLPFHIAVFPVVCKVLTPPISGLLEAEDADARDEAPFLFDVDASGATKVLVEELNNLAFVRATAIGAEDDSAPVDSVAAASARYQRLVEEAQASNADLILVPTLSYEREIYSKSPWYFAVPLFLFTAPGSLFVADRSYSVRANLNGALYNLNAIRPQDAYDSIRVGRNSVLNAESEFSDVNIRFVDRARGALSYVNTIVWPAGWLSSETDKAKATLQEKLVRDLCTGFASELHEGDWRKGNARRIIEAEGSTNHFFDLESTVVQWRSDGKVDFKTKLLLSTARNVNELQSYKIQAGTQTVSEDSFDEGESYEIPPRQYKRYSIDTELTVDRSQKALRLVVVEASPGKVRSYTFPIASPAQEAGG